MSLWLQALWARPFGWWTGQVGAGEGENKGSREKTAETSRHRNEKMKERKVVEEGRYITRRKGTKEVERSCPPRSGGCPSGPPRLSESGHFESIHFGPRRWFGRWIRVGYRSGRMSRGNVRSSRYQDRSSRSCAGPAASVPIRDLRSGRRNGGMLRTTTTTKSYIFIIN